MPAAAEPLAAFLAERAESGICFGTIDGYCSAIAHRHHHEGLPDPTADVVVRRVRRGLRRIMGTAPRRQAHPLTVDELSQLVAAIDPLTAIGARDRPSFCSATPPRCVPASSPPSISPTS
jgi:hypothetical protein